LEGKIEEEDKKKYEKRKNREPEITKNIRDD
jgi:hypothetical protein